MGVVSLHSAGKEAAFYPIDYRVYAPEVDGKTKNTHFQEMFKNALTHKWLQARTIVFDSWYASAANRKLIHRRARIFFTTRKSNQSLVSLSKEEGYIHLTEVEWTPERLAQGVIVKLKEVPFQVRLFKLVAPDGDIDWGITNDLDETVTAQVAKDSSDVRWQVEEVHRGLKQLTGSEKCQCRGARAQRNHLACCYHAWVSLKVKAQELRQTMYELHENLSGTICGRSSRILGSQLVHPAERKNLYIKVLDESNQHCIRRLFGCGFSPQVFGGTIW